MTTQIRQPGASYPLSLLGEARKVFRGGRGCAVEFAELHGVKRTTALGWKRKAEARKPLRRKGMQRKFGAFEETKLLQKILNNGGFETPKSIMNYAQTSHEPLAKRTAQRMLARWGILADKCRIPDRGERGRVLLLWRRDWTQPDDSVQSGRQPVRAVLWVLASRKGMKGFMLTGDSDENKVLGRVLAALEGAITPRHLLLTNSRQLARASTERNCRWKVSVVDG